MHKPITKVSRVSEYYLSVRTHKLATLKERKIAYFIWRQKFDLTISLNSGNYPKIVMEKISHRFLQKNYSSMLPEPWYY